MIYYFLPALLTRLDALPTLRADDADPVALHDLQTDTTWMSEVRRDGRGTGLSCSLIQRSDRRDLQTVEIRAQAVKRLWKITAWTITGRPISPGDDAETVLTVLAVARRRIRAALVPDLTM